MGKAFEKRYSAVDEMTQGAAIVPSAPLKEAGEGLKNRLLQLMGEEPDAVVFDATEMGGASPAKAAKEKREKEVFAKAPLQLQQLVGVVKQLDRLPENLPLMQAQRLRSELIKLSTPQGLTPDALSHEFGTLRNAADEAFTLAEKTPQGSAVKELRATNADYREAIAKYKNRTLNKIVSDAKSGIYPDDAVFVDSVIKEGQADLVRTLKGVMGPEKWQGIQRAYWDSLMRPPGGLPIVPNEVLFERLASNEGRSVRESGVRKRFGRAYANGGTQGFPAINKHKEKISTQRPPTRRFCERGEETVELQEARNTFLKKNYIQELVRLSRVPTGKEGAYEQLAPVLEGKQHDIFDWLTEGNKKDQIQAAYDIFGKNSVIGQGIRDAAIIKIVGNAASKIGSVSEKETALGMGKAMRQSLEGFGGARKFFSDEEYEDHVLRRKRWMLCLSGQATSGVVGFRHG